MHAFIGKCGKRSVSSQCRSHISIHVNIIIFSCIENNCTACCCCEDNKVKMARKPGKKQKENPAGCTGEGKILKANKRKVQRR